MCSAPATFHLGLVPCSTHTVSALLSEIRLLLANRAIAPRTIACVNAHIYNLAVRDQSLLGHLNAARLVAADGMSIVWAARWLGIPVRERCNMTEAFHAFVADPATPPTRAALLGCLPSEAASAAARIEAVCRHCRIVVSGGGYSDDAEYRRLLRGAGDLDLVLLGMGTPKTERLLSVVAETCPQAVVWHIGGGTIQFYAGTLKESPPWLKPRGMQWLHRIYLEPRRMWRRYLVGNPLFVYYILRQRLSRHG
ncbi:MAG: WecB/TagA/CpsF family glycosyltransferase [Verrucomicrobia bacterium]|nr:WecB/TagA/CpsF family glycosyltransferase [Verrucomicrobiota bacterium]